MRAGRDRCRTAALRVGVVGAGLGGLAAAVALALDGHDVEVLERAEDPRPVGAGILLQPPGVGMLERLGCPMPPGARVSRLHSTTPGGRTLIDLDYAWLAPGLHGLGVSRPAIWSALAGRAERAGVRILPGMRATSVDGGQGRARVGLEGRAARDYDVAVVASGTHTDLWRGPGRRSPPYAWGCLWATVPLPRGWPLGVLQQRCAGTRVMVGVLPLGEAGGREVGAVYWSIRNDRLLEWQQAPLRLWQDDVARAWPEAGALVAGLCREEVRHAAYRDVWADPPHRGRAVVIGDAAHGTSPQLGQGTTQAFRDAEELSCALAAAPTPEEGLAAYWAGRKARTRYYRMASRLLTPLFQSDVPFLGAARDLLAGPVGALPWVRRQALLTLAGAKAGFLSADMPSHPPRTRS